MLTFKPGLSDLVKSSFRSIFKNRGRTILTSLGIIIGVTSVILLTSIGNGLKKYVNDQFESLGTNSIFIYPGQVFNERGGFNRGGMVINTKFNLKDVQRLKRKFKDFLVMPASVNFYNIKSPFTTKKSVETAGSSSDYGPNNNLVPSAGNGRWFTNEEDDKKSLVIVLGYKIAQDLFPTGSALGKKVIVKGKNLKVIGIIDKKGASMGGPGIDDHVFIPLSIAFNLSGNQDLNTIVVKVTERTREIGLRKAVGAYPQAILLQFLFEAIILSCFGGFIGILLGFIGTSVINNFLPATLTLGSILIAFGVSSLVGVVFGVTPARKASKLSPIEALRYE